MATPHVAGAAALYLSVNRTATPFQVAATLIGRATVGVVTSPGTGSPNRLLYTGFDLAPPPPASPPPSQPSNLNLLGNPGFETGSAAPWAATAGVIDNSASPAAHTGSWKAWLDGYGRTHTDTLYQQVTIPADAVTATFSFWRWITTAETTTTALNDTLTVKVLDTGGNLLRTLATYSNLNRTTGYVRDSFDIMAYRGQTVRFQFRGIENASRQTSFILDDVTLDITR
jgi:hypothetical protein